MGGVTDYQAEQEFRFNMDVHCNIRTPMFLKNKADIYHGYTITYAWGHFSVSMVISDYIYQVHVVNLIH